ncbi:MAG TPA: redoxin family protein [Ilumatobacteraceae bacterium]|nr:redoxin family protein [Ilumatobacteraceae bacterium]
MKNRTVIIVIGVIVLVVGLAGAAVLLTGGDDEDSSGVLAPGETTAPTYGDDVQESRPVEVTGAPLPALGEGADPAIGSPMPVIVGATFDGNALTVGGPTDGPTLYAFLAHWCPACNEEIPEMVQLRNRGGVPEGMNVVAISTAVETSGPNYPPSKWIVDKEWPSEWPVMADSAESTSFVVAGGGAFPYLMVVDAEGTVLARASGVKSAEDLATWISDALATAA